MKAFLSHSSKDKWFVSQVFAALGAAQCEYDEKTFEPILNVQAIRDALKRSDIFVQFLSESSIESNYVKEEQRVALEALGRGTLRKVLIIAIDETSYRQLPKWLQETNVLQRVSNPRRAATRIQSTLISLSAESNLTGEIFVNREDEIQRMRRALSAAPGIAPTVLHVSGYHGVGRRTLIRHCLRQVFPTLDSPVELSLANYEGAEELYRRLHELHKISSVKQKIEDFEKFSKLDEDTQAQLIAELLREMSEKNDFIIINDEGGVLSDDGDYQTYLTRVVENIGDLPKPIIGFMQTRRMRAVKQNDHPNTFHIQLMSLNDEHTKELLSFELKRNGVDFTQLQLNNLCALVDGHPYNAKFAIHYVERYGLDSALFAPEEIVDWKRRRAIEFLRKIEFDPTGLRILALTRLLRYISVETVIESLGVATEEVAEALRYLEDACCLERRGGYYSIPLPLIDAVNRDDRFASTAEQDEEIAKRLLESLDTYTDEDHVPIATLETATLAAIKAGSVPQARFVATFLLPSHLLRIARSYYDDRSWRQCSEFCDKALGMATRLTADARIETLRLSGLSAARLADSSKIEEAISSLEKIGSRNARKQAFFLRGFRARLKGRWEEAEENFLEAFSISNSNNSVNRELATIYCAQGRFSEAEGFARRAFEVAPTNPFIIDIMVRVISGKFAQGLLKSDGELNDLLKQLKLHGSEPGISFYDMRQADRSLKQGDLPSARRYADAAVNKTPGLIEAYCLRAEIALASNATAEAERDIKEVNRLLEQAGGYTPEDEARVAELEIRLHIERLEFQSAKDKAERSNVLPYTVSARLLKQIARAIAFEPKHASFGLQNWAKRYRG